MKASVLLGALLLLTACGQQKKAEPSSTTPAEDLISRLQESYASGKTIVGHHDDPDYGHSWKWEEGRSDIKEITGRYPALMEWDLSRLELGDSLNIDSVPFARIRREVIDQNARGGYVAFDWHPWHPVDNLDSWQATDTTMVARLVNPGPGNEAYLANVRKLAKWINGLQTPEGEKIGVIFRPWHEHTGDWFWWGAAQCTVDDYTKLWTQMRAVFDEEGVDNVVWAYSTDRVKDMDQYMERYPGDEYVDIMAADVYHYGGKDGIATYDTDARRTLQTVIEAAKAHGKIPAFTETGSESLPVENWFTGVLDPILKDNHVAYVLLWRNAHDKPNHFYAPWPGHPTEPDFRTFAADTTYVFVE